MIRVYMTGLCYDIMLSHFLTGSNWHAGLRSAHGANMRKPRQTRPHQRLEIAEQHGIPNWQGACVVSWDHSISIDFLE
jgi:hypothetical protein